MRKLLFISLMSFIILPILTNANGGDSQVSHGMMGFGGLWPWIMLLIPLVWLVVGILVIVWLWKQITKK